MQRTMIGHRSDALQARARYVARQRCAVILEAPAGYGKSTLLRQISTQATSSVLVGRANDLASLTVDDSLTCHVLVDVEDPDITHVERLAAAKGTVSLTLAGRYISSDCRALLRDFGLVELGPANVRIGVEEARELLEQLSVYGDAGAIAEWIVAQCDGWPAPIARLVAWLSAGGKQAFAALERSTPDLCSCPPIDRLMEDMRRSWPPDVSTGVERFGGLGRLTLGAYEEVVGDGAMRRAIRAGVPYLLQPDGWISLNPMMRQHLGCSPDIEDAQKIAPALARTGGLIPATQILTTSGAFDGAANLLLSATPDRLDGTDPHQLLALCDIVAPHSDRTIELGLLRARALENLGDLTSARQVLEQTAAIAQPGSALKFDVSLELQRSRIMGGEPAVPQEPRAAVSSPTQRARLREVEGLRDALSQEPSRVEGSIDTLRLCAAEWESLGYHGRAASLLRTLASMPLTHLGRFADAIDAVQHARRLSWNRLYDRALCSVLLVVLGAQAARFDLVEREMSAARSLRSVVDLPWLDFYLAGAAVDVAAYKGQVDEAATSARITAELIGDLEDHPTAVTVHSLVASSLAVVGCEELARVHLERAVRHRSRNETEVLMAEVAVHARARDIEVARRKLAEIEASPVIPRDRIWRARLEVGLATDAPELVDQSRVEANALRLDTLFDALSPGAASRPTVIRALGQLRVQVAGGAEVPVSGKPGDLLARLLSHGRSAPIESLVDALWPETSDIEHGRQLLRNPLSRLRTHLGPNSISRTDRTIALASTIHIDVDEFERKASEADDGGSPAAVIDGAVDALNMYQPFLSDRSDLGDGDIRRTALSLRAGSLLDTLLSTDAPTGPSSSWLLAVALRVDPDADERLVKIAERSLAENNPSAAVAATQAALRAVERLEVPISPRLEAVRMATASGRGPSA